MACYYPIQGYQARVPNASGKYSIVFNPNQGWLDRPRIISCGRCIGCRLEYSRQWAVRCMHEAQLHDRNCFITLTYSDEYLPEGGTLVLDHFQRFMKRLRKKFGNGIKFYHCGEYGEKFGRPHYHAIIFGLDFDDKVVDKKCNGFNYYYSETLQNLWKYGKPIVCDVSFDTCAYVARYMLKKVNGDMAFEHYSTVDCRTGEISQRKPEYCTMSKKEGIGKRWYEKFKSDVYPSDYLIVKEMKVKPPKYYDGLFEIDDPDMFDKIKSRRKRRGKKYENDSTPERLAVREKVQLSKIKKLKRGYENDL